MHHRDGSPTADPGHRWAGADRFGVARRAIGPLTALRHSRLAKGRTLGVFFFAGGTLALVVLALPHSNAIAVGPLAATALAACATGTTLWLVGMHLGDRVLHGLLALGTALISLAAYLCHGSGPTVGFAFFYTWVTLYAFFYFRPTAARLHLLLCAAAYAVVLVVDGGHDGPADWVLVVGTATTTGVVIGALTAELFRAQANLVRQERLAAVGEMATVVGHELRNPLGAVINSLFLAQATLGSATDPSVRGHLDAAERQIDRAVALSESLTALVHEAVPIRAILDVRELVDRALDAAPPPAGVTVSVPAPGPSVDADAEQFTQVLVNLVTNAYQAMPGGGTVTIGASEGGSATRITVHDSGEGIDPAVAERLFEPFVTTRPSGAGLGLAVVKRIVDAHGGTVGVSAAAAGGTQASVLLPRRATTAPR